MNVDDVEALINRFMDDNSDWWDEDEEFDLGYEIVDKMFPEIKSENLHLDLECVATDALENLTPNTRTPRKVRKAAEKIYADLHKEHEKWVARKLLRAAKRKVS